MSVLFYPLTLSPPSAFLSPTRLPPSAGALAPPPALPGGSRATRRRRIEPRARLRGAEAGLAAAGLGSGCARAGHGRPQLASCAWRSLRRQLRPVSKPGRFCPVSAAQ